MIASALRGTNAGPPPNGSSDPNETPHNQETYNQDQAFNSNGYWRAADIGFFWPDMPRSWGTGDVIDKDDKAYYRAAYAFTNRLRVAAPTKDFRKICQNMDICFRGEAASWGTNELNDIMRRGLLHAVSIDEWYSVIEKRFRMPPQSGPG